MFLPPYTFGSLACISYTVFFDLDECCFTMCWLHC